MTSAVADDEKNIRTPTSKSSANENKDFMETIYVIFHKTYEQNTKK